EPSSYEVVVRPFLDAYCVSCHGPKTQKADRRFDTLGPDLASRDAMELWQEIADRLDLREMPPPKAKQPEPTQTRRVIDWITSTLREAHAARASEGSRTVLRRLNRAEYNRTVRHLLCLEPLLTDPTDSFPPDETAGDLDNVGSALVTSGFLLQNYL